MLRGARHLAWILGGATLLLGLADRARAQGPTTDLAGPIELRTRDLSPTGFSPGALGAPNFNEIGQDAPIAGGVGPGVPRVPASVTTPPSERLTQPNVLNLPDPLQLPAPPNFGSLDFPSVEDAGPPGGLTLDEAIERLVRDNLELRARSLEIPQAEADILTASLRANPILFADAQLVPYGEFSEQRPGGQTQYDLNVSIPLDITRKRRERTRVATQAKRVVEAQYQDAVRLQLDNLYTTYVAVQAAQLRVRYAQASVEALDLILEPLANQVTAGKITSADRNRVVLQRETAALLVRDDEEGLLRARRELARLLNGDSAAATELAVSGPLRNPGFEPPPVEEQIEIALCNRPDVVAFRLGVQRAQDEVRLADANRLNDLFLLYQPFTYQDNAPFGLPSTRSWAVGLTVPFPLWNRNQGNRRRARMNVTQSHTELHEVMQRVVTEVRQADAEYRVSQEAIQRPPRRRGRPPHRQPTVLRRRHRPDLLHHGPPGLPAGRPPLPRQPDPPARRRPADQHRRRAPNPPLTAPRHPTPQKRQPPGRP
jgi:cobalt-zinc-cadmium efflux system outer membrane protein